MPAGFLGAGSSTTGSEIPGAVERREVNTTTVDPYALRALAADIKDVLLRFRGHDHDVETLRSAVEDLLALAPEEGQHPERLLGTSTHRDPEVWDAIVDAIETRFLRTEFEEGEFSVHHNNGVQSVTIIRNGDRRAWVVTDTTGSHYDAEGRIVFPR